MKTDDRLKWGVAAVVVLGLGLLATAGAAQASEGENEDEGKGLADSGVRHGIRYEGCKHFELVDPDAVEAWAIDNSWQFAKWALRLDELRANPEPAIVEALAMLFPECTWPPGKAVTFGTTRVGWVEAMALAKEAVQDFDFAVADPVAAGPGIAGMLLRRALAFGLRAPSTRPGRPSARLSSTFSPLPG